MYQTETFLYCFILFYCSMCAGPLYGYRTKSAATLYVAVIYASPVILCHGTWIHALNLITPRQNTSNCQTYFRETELTVTAVHNNVKARTKRCSWTEL